jgi:hypothetical protein
MFKLIIILILDSESYLSNVRKCLENECTKRGLGQHIVKYYGLISARTGYGIEELISKVFRYWSQHGLSLLFFHFIFLFNVNI